MKSSHYWCRNVATNKDNSNNWIKYVFVFVTACQTLWWSILIYIWVRWAQYWHLSCQQAERFDWPFNILVLARATLVTMSAETRIHNWRWNRVLRSDRNDGSFTPWDQTEIWFLELECRATEYYSRHEYSLVVSFEFLCLVK